MTTGRRQQAWHWSSNVTPNTRAQIRPYLLTLIFKEFLCSLVTESSNASAYKRCHSYLSTTASLAGVGVGTWACPVSSSMVHRGSELPFILHYTESSHHPQSWGEISYLWTDMFWNLIVVMPSSPATLSEITELAISLPVSLLPHRQKQYRVSPF